MDQADVAGRGMHRRWCAQTDTGAQGRLGRGELGLGVPCPPTGVSSRTQVECVRMADASRLERTKSSQTESNGNQCSARAIHQKRLKLRESMQIKMLHGMRWLTHSGNLANSPWPFPSKSCSSSST